MAQSQERGNGTENQRANSFVKPASEFLVYLWEHTSRINFVLPGCMSVSIAGEFDKEKSLTQLRLNGVAVRNQKEKEQEREERIQGPSWSFIYDLFCDFS